MNSIILDQHIAAMCIWTCIESKRIARKEWRVKLLFDELYYATLDAVEVVRSVSRMVARPRTEALCLVTATGCDLLLARLGKGPNQRLYVGSLVGLA